MILLGVRTQRNWALGVAVLAVASAMKAPASGPQPKGIGDDQCQSWQAKYSSLSSEQQALVHRYGVVRTDEWVLSPELVRVCATRLAVESFLRAAVAGDSTLIDRQFVAANRGTLFRVLQRTWPIMGNSLAVPSDGAFNHEKWGILRSAGLNAREMADLLRTSLRVEGVSSGFVCFFLEEPNPRLVRDIRDILRRERNPATAKDRTATTQLYCLVLLYSIRDTRGIDDGLLHVANDERATGAEKIVAKRIRDLVAKGQPVTWVELETLELP